MDRLAPFLMGNDDLWIGLPLVSSVTGWKIPELNGGLSLARKITDFIWFLLSVFQHATFDSRRVVTLPGKYDFLGTSSAWKKKRIFHNPQMLRQTLFSSELPSVCSNPTSCPSMLRDLHIFSVLVLPGCIPEHVVFPPRLGLYLPYLRSYLRFPIGPCHQFFAAKKY